MTGGGFGGCTVTLVERSAVAALEKALKEQYWAQAKCRCDCYECLPAAGAGTLDLTPHLQRPFPTASVAANGFGRGSDSAGKNGDASYVSHRAAVDEDASASGGGGGIGSTLLDYALPIAVTVMVTAVTLGALMAFRRAK